VLRLLVVAAALLSACQRVSPQDCEKICWRSNELAFWEKAAEDGKALAPEARQRLLDERKQKWAAMRKLEFDPGLENCIKECRRAARPEDVACVEKATTAAAAQACLK
jgi:hypothetical protein